jgi:hypothetical protein
MKLLDVTLLSIVAPPTNESLAFEAAHTALTA